MRLFLAILIIAPFLYFKINLAFSQTEYTALDMRDPFESQLPQITEEPKEVVSETTKQPVVAPALIVESLIAGGYIPQTIIAGKIYRIGDKVGDSLVTDITKEGVEIIYQGRTFMLAAPSKMMQATDKGDNNGK